MATWTKTLDEYAHARQIILDSTDYLGGPAKLLLKNGNVVEGHIVGSNSGTDVGHNMDAGRGAIVTAMYGEIQLRLPTEQVVLIDAQSIERFFK